MSINKILSAIAIAIGLISVLIAIISLIHIVTSAPAPAVMIDNLRGWIENTGYRLSIIILAVSATLYLAKKK